MDAYPDVHPRTSRSAMWHDAQLGLALALLVAVAVWLNGYRASAAARAVAYGRGVVGARADYARELAAARGHRQQLERARQDVAATARSADSLARGRESALRLAEASAAANAAAAARRIPPLAARARAASRSAWWLAAAMVAVLAIGVVPAREWRRVQRRRPRAALGAAGP